MWNNQQHTVYSKTNHQAVTRWWNHLTLFLISKWSVAENGNQRLRRCQRLMFLNNYWHANECTHTTYVVYLTAINISLFKRWFKWYYIYVKLKHLILTLSVCSPFLIINYIVSNDYDFKCWTIFVGRFHFWVSCRLARRFY